MRLSPLVLALILACRRSEDVTVEDVRELRVDAAAECPEADDVLRDEPHLDEAELTETGLHEVARCWYRAELVLRHPDAGADEADAASVDTTPTVGGCDSTLNELRAREYQRSLRDGQEWVGARMLSFCTPTGPVAVAPAVEGECPPAEQLERDWWNLDWDARATELILLEQRVYRSCTYETLNEYERQSGGCGTAGVFARR